VITVARPVIGSYARTTLLDGHWWVIAVIVTASLVGALPLLLATCCAPHGATGLGTVWFVNDFAQYESAMRQGAQQPGWLIHDPFTAEPHQPALMFTMFVGLGKLAAISRLPAEALERLAEVLARAAVVLALWHFCSTFTTSRSAARWAVVLTLFGSGFEIVGALLGGYGGNWSYETNGFGLLFAAPHVPLAMAATLVLAARYLVPRERFDLADLGVCVALSAAVALLHPFHVPVLLGALTLTGLAYWRTQRGHANLLAAIAACLGALPVLMATVSTFWFDPFWLQTYGEQNLLPSPAPHELLVDLGPTLVLALGGAWFLRGRVAPFGLLVWLLLAAIAMYVPVPFQRRLSFGIQPAMAVLAANTLVAWCASASVRSAIWIRLGVVAAAASGTVLILVSVIGSSLSNAPLTVYRSTQDLDRATAWLAYEVAPDEVILADWDTGNYLAARIKGRVFGGHPVATLHATEKRFLIASVFAHPSSLSVAGSFGARWLVYGPAEAGMSLPGTPAFQSGGVRVYRVGR
jgi:hypothetical protein